MVMESPDDGPVALMPTEIEVYNVDRKIEESLLDLEKWQMEQSGLAPEVISQEMKEKRKNSVVFYSRPPVSWTLPKEGTHVKLISPPRMSRKMIHQV